jgi:UDP-N-acetylglucosamine 2-epimerase (non-hydrolysing)/GDP/UDP-N,N'-diacetylbacillosamine 2-epimerase (hydrolysing)
MRVGAVSVARSDFSILRPVLRRLEEDASYALDVVVAGMHLAPEFGLTVREVEAEGFNIVERVEMNVASDSPTGTALSIGLGCIGFGTLFARWRPDVLLVMGDRFEMFAAALAAQSFGLPVVHIHGGETSEGAVDEAYRHAITKMSQVHFTATEQYRKRVIQLGEHPDRVFNCGAPALDNLPGVEQVSMAALSTRLGLDLHSGPIVVTLHPETRRLEETRNLINSVTEVLESLDHPIVITAPNADPAGRMIKAAFASFALKRQNVATVDNLGVEGYYQLLSHARLMLGNSSSGIIEAASFELPVVNIGVRQRGRICGDNVLHAEATAEAIGCAVEKALSGAFRNRLTGMDNPYGDGNAAEQIAATLRYVDISSSALLKKFYDVPVPA